MVVLCHSQQQAEHVKAQLAKWLEPRGLAFNEDKTKIVHLSEGFDFLGFNIRRYPNRKLLIKPSQAAIRRVRERLASELRTLRGGNATAVIAALNPVIRGWAAYYRGVVSSGVFSSLDDYLWKLTYKWATWRHNNKPKRWIAGRYFGKFNKFRNDRWVFGDRDSGACLVKFTWTNIERHVPVTGAASPDDPALARYWAERRKKARPPLDGYTLRLLARQDGRCPLCEDHLLSPDQPPQSPQQWERWWLQVTRRAIAASYLTHHGRPGLADGDQTRLVHASCLRGAPRPPAQETSTSTRNALAACLSRVPRRVARTVLRGPRRGNAPGLPDCRVGALWRWLLLCRTARDGTAVAMAVWQYAQLPIAVGSGSAHGKGSRAPWRVVRCQSGGPPIREGADAGAEGQAERCWIWPGLVGCLPAARIVGAACLQVRRRPCVAAAGPRGAGA